ncbi:MAG: sigma 54-interacting transcriptional regulator [Deltaproteobacteria bacterium]|nr:sigma 54-interacting transcriptional regulator [Deltaproteobacteria bacterium]
MKPSNLSIIDVLDFLPDHGLVELENRRVLIFDGNILMELRSQIVQNLGWENCKPIIFNYGYQMGNMDAKSLGQMYQWESKEEWFKAGAMMQTQRGYCKTVLSHLSFNPDDGHLIFRGRWFNSYEVDSHKHLKLTETGPVCYVLCGYLSGFASCCFNRKVLVQEQECLHRQHCSFEGRFVEGWGESGIKFMKDSNDLDLNNKYVELNKKMAAGRNKKVHKNKDVHTNDIKALHGLELLPFRSKSMSRVLEMAHQVANTAANVLITGETGVGKEVIANFIHSLSPKSTSRFLPINCTALPLTLLESELFGHVKGAFTGADRNKKGLLIEADNGTIFLDEIGDIALSIQVKLLRALQEKRVRPVGGSTELPIKARIVASTNRNLEEMVREGKFRADLYYRLNVFPIHLPALRERRDDILPIARYFLTKFAPNSLGFSPRVAHILENYNWPGNVRELANAVERASILAGNQKIRFEHLPPALTGSDEACVFNQVKDGWPPLEELEQKYILSVLDHCEGKRMKAAQLLGIGSNTLWRKLKKYQLN